MVVFKDEKYHCPITKRDMAFSFLDDQNAMWKFEQIIYLIKNEMKTPQDIQEGINKINEYWKDSKCLFELFGKKEMIDLSSMDEHRYKKLTHLFQSYKTRLTNTFKVDHYLTKQKVDFFSDFTNSTLTKIKVRGEMRPSQQLQKLFFAFGIDCSMMNCLIKPRIDLIDTVTYDIYNLIRYININKIQKIHLSYYPPLNDM